MSVARVAFGATPHRICSSNTGGVIVCVARWVKVTRDVDRESLQFMTTESKLPELVKKYRRSNPKRLKDSASFWGGFKLELLRIPVSRVSADHALEVLKSSRRKSSETEEIGKTIKY